MLKKFVLGTIAAVVLAACGGEGSNSASSAPAQSGAASGSLIERINNKGTITVGTEGTYAPFTYHDKDGKLTGYDVEVTRAVADKLGVKVEFKETQWDSMMAGLKAGRFDVATLIVSLRRIDLIIGFPLPRGFFRSSNRRLIAAVAHRIIIARIRTVWHRYLICHPDPFARPQSAQTPFFRIGQLLAAIIEFRKTYVPRHVGRFRFVDLFRYQRYVFCRNRFRQADDLHA